MAFTIMALLEAGLLFVNAICVLHEQRFLAKGEKNFRNYNDFTSSFFLVVLETIYLMKMKEFMCTLCERKKPVWICTKELVP